MTGPLELRGCVAVYISTHNSSTVARPITCAGFSPLLISKMRCRTNLGLRGLCTRILSASSCVEPRLYTWDALKHRPDCPSVKVNVGGGRGKLPHSSEYLPRVVQSYRGSNLISV
eukprot:138725-Prorocentrum_minimum.AAC.5